MKAYNLKATKTEVAGRSLEVITLGEVGRGRTSITVPCSAGLNDGDSVSVTLPSVSAAGVKKKPSIKAEKIRGHAEWCARISTDGAYIRGAQGNVSYDPEQAPEAPMLVAKAYGAFGAAGRTGNWDDVIVAVKFGTVLRVKPTRGDAYYLFFERDSVSKLTRDELDLLEIPFDLDSRIRL